MKLIMKSKQCYTIILLVLFSLERQNANAQAPHCIWAKSIGGLGYDAINSIAIDPDGSGDMYATGYFSGTVDFNPGEDVFNLTVNGSASFISKLDGSGNFVWAKMQGGSANAITIDPGEGGGIYITGKFGGTVDFDPGPGVFNLTSAMSASSSFISKLDRAGNFIWAKAIGGSEGDNGSEGASIAVDPGSGDVYITGEFGGTVDFDPGASVFNLTSVGSADSYIAKLDSSGNFLWAKAMGGSNSYTSYAIAIDPSGNRGVYTTGDFNETVDFDPGEDTFNLTSAGYHDIFISKLDSSGNFLWARTMGGTDGDYSYSIAVDVEGSGGVYTTGKFWKKADFDPGEDTFNLTAYGPAIFISKLDSNGNFAWAKVQGGANGAAIGLAIRIDPAGSGDVYTSGAFGGAPVDFDPGEDLFNLTAVGDFDVFISKLNRFGDFQWAKSMGGSLSDYGLSIALDGIGNLNVAGYFESPDFLADTIHLSGHGSQEDSPDIFIAQLNMTTATVHVDSKAQQISIYPNPASNELIIEVEEGDNVTMDISLFTILGQLVYSANDQNMGQKRTIDIHTLPAGIYFIEFDINGIHVVKKVLKE